MLKFKGILENTWFLVFSIVPLQQYKVIDMDIKEQVLSREQMKNLLSLGVDASAASHFYVRAVQMEGFQKNNCLDCDMAELKFSLQNHFPVAAAWKVESIPTFNSDEIVRLLPRIISIGGVKFGLVVNYGDNHIGYYSLQNNIIVHTLVEFDIKGRIIDALYDVLVWYFGEKDKFDIL